AGGQRLVGCGLSWRGASRRIEPAVDLEEPGVRTEVRRLADQKARSRVGARPVGFERGLSRGKREPGIRRDNVVVPSVVDCLPPRGTIPETRGPPVSRSVCNVLHVIREVLAVEWILSEEVDD